MSTRALIIVHGKSGPPGYVYVSSNAYPSWIDDIVKSFYSEGDIGNTNRQIAIRLAGDWADGISVKDAIDVATFVDYLYELQARSGRVRVRSHILGFPGVFERKTSGKECIQEILGNKRMGL